MATQTRKNRLPRKMATMHQLNKWFKAEFEKLGWMVLAKAKGYDDKIAMYKKSVGHLIDSIEHVMGEYEDHNRKHDLNVLLMEAKVLKNFVMKHM